MRKLALSLTTAAFASVATMASAADVVFQEPPAPAPMAVAPAVYDWTGVYLGAHGGYSWMRIVGDDFESERFDGFLLGGHVGANWQMNSWVFGVEGDVSYAWNDNTYATDLGDVEIGTDWQGSIRARAGYAIDRTLIFATGGLAFTRGYVELDGDKETETFTGWTVGGGLEHAFTDNWTARLEYRYADYGTETFNFDSDADARLREHTVRAGVSYKF